MRTNYPRHLPAFPYVGFHRYFLTFCTHDRTRVFVRDSTTELVWSQFLRAARQEAFVITACCFMPDHVHLLVEGESDASDLKRFIARAKQFSGYYYARAHGASLWQRYGHEHVLRDDEKSRSVVAYILENPVRASLVRTVHEYRHVRSSRYSVKELIEFAYARSG